MRLGLIVLGLALGVLWLVGMSNGVAGWMVWLDFCVALVSLLAGLGFDRLPDRFARGVTGASIPVALAVSLLVLWIIGLAEGASRWYAWWTFAFGIAYGILGFARPSESSISAPTVTRNA